MTSRTWSPILISAAALTHITLAQEPLAVTGDPMTVTASRIGTAITEFAGNATVLTRNDLLERGHTTVADALRDLEGVLVRSTSGNPASSEITMRGFGENGHGRVLVLLDGHPVNRPDMAGINWLQFPVIHLETVEILRGSQTALYGDHAIGGVIHLQSRRGTEDASLRISAEGGSFGMNAQQASAGGSFRAMEYVVTADRFELDGYRDRSGADAFALGVTAGFHPHERVSSRVALSQQTISYEMPGGLTAAQMAEDRRQAINLQDEADEIYLKLGAEVTLDMTPDQQLSLGMQYDRKQLEGDFTSYFSFSDTDIETFALTPRYLLHHTLLGRPNRVLLGLDLTRNDLTVDRFSDAARIGAANSCGDIRKTTLSGYVRNEHSLPGQMLFGLGARVEQAEIRAEVQSMGMTTVDSRLTHDTWAMDTSLVKLLEGQSRLFARAATVYRYPFVDEQVSYYGFGDALYTDLDPEQGLSIEAGVRHDSGGTLAAGLTAFLLNMEDEIAFNGTTFRNENMDKTRRIGLEADILWRIHDAWKIQANYTYTQAEFTSGAYEGHQVPLVPEHKAAVHTTVHLPFSTTVFAGVTHVGDSHLGGDYANHGAKLKHYTVVDLFARYTCPIIKGLELFAGINNLLDEKYAEVAYQGFSGDAYYPAPGVAYRAGVAYNF